MVRNLKNLLPLCLSSEALAIIPSFINLFTSLRGLKIRIDLFERSPLVEAPEAEIEIRADGLVPLALSQLLIDVPLTWFLASFDIIGSILAFHLIHGLFILLTHAGGRLTNSPSVRNIGVAFLQWAAAAPFDLRGIVCNSSPF
jgi:hypothetical protein